MWEDRALHGDAGRIDVNDTEDRQKFIKYSVEVV